MLAYGAELATGSCEVSARLGEDKLGLPGGGRRARRGLRTLGRAGPSGRPGRRAAHHCRAGRPHRRARGDGRLRRRARDRRRRGAATRRRATRPRSVPDLRRPHRDDPRGARHRATSSRSRSRASRLRGARCRPRRSTGPASRSRPSPTSRAACCSAIPCTSRIRGARCTAAEVRRGRLLGRAHRRAAARQVEADLGQLALSAPCADTIARLRCLRGIDTLTALGLCSEIGEWERFDHPDQLSCLPRDRPLRAHHRSASVGSGRSPRPAPRAPDGCWSRPPTTTAAVGGRCGARAPPARPSTRDHPHLLARATPARAPAGASSKMPATNPVGSSRSRSPASSPRTAGRSPPGPLIPIGFRRHPCRRATPSRTQPRSRTSTHPPPAGGSPTRAELTFAHTTRCGWRGGPSLPARAHNSAICRLSNPPGRPRSTLDSGRATNKGLGVPSPRI